MIKERQLQGVLMEGPCWRLLAMYCYVLSRRAKAQGVKTRVTMSKALGAIVSRFLLAHQERIIDEYQKVRVAGLIVPRSIKRDGTLKDLVSEVRGLGDARPWEADEAGDEA